MAGYAWMSLAVLIWAGWLVLTSSGHTTALSVVDLATLRALIPAAVLSPLLWRHRRTVAQLGVMRCLMLSAYGAPFTLLVGYGLGLAPVAHAGALVPGLMPVFAFGLACMFLGQRLSRRYVVSVFFILSGAAAIVLRGAGHAATQDPSAGHLLFLLGALCWACFTVTIRAFGIPAFLATAVVGTVSAALLFPVWMLSDLSNFSEAHWTDIAFQAVFQGIISGLVSLVAFSRALRLIGGQASALSALTPGVATLLAVPVLGQTPHSIDVLAIVFVVTGLIIWNRAASQPDYSRERI
ncbi:DMT family transporter [uncultured Roseobacter sp.]|uniref:DMT family transporter n=1 Tax=uncultured Roseobacter sp. TaxID=114847 RepID=UPI00262E68FC|nr:DMT family transporter [uncultured Roseobacter sp.]